MAVFSMHDLPCIYYNAADDMLWYNTSWTHYWEKDVCIPPLYRPSDVGYWVVCNLLFKKKASSL
ncbi:hypothetical protein EV424DRAFT_1328141 [Suillus variegatus]|nr:hypothetical protein EV424DRAFT_1328141 [Suillus variegatus]